MLRILLVAMLSAVYCCSTAQECECNWAISELRQELSSIRVIPQTNLIEYKAHIQETTESMAPIFLFCGLSLEVLFSQRLVQMLSFAPSLYGVAVGIAALSPLLPSPIPAYESCTSSHTPNKGLFCSTVQLKSIPDCSVYSYDNSPYSYDVFMKDKPAIWHDRVSLGEYELYAQFQYISGTVISQNKYDTVRLADGKTVINGSIEIYKNGTFVDEF